MIVMTLILPIFMLISFTLMLLNFLMSKKMFLDREKMSPFECGFDPLSNNYLPFSSHFFIISLMFLIFDIEIALLVPLIYLFYSFSPSVIITSLMFITILIYGLYLEYLEQSIDWKM